MKGALGVCPVGQTPYVHPTTGNTIKCNPMSYGTTCPVGYSCQATILGANWGFCCSDEVTGSFFYSVK